jgi:hypothetical protein
MFILRLSFVYPSVIYRLSIGYYGWKGVAKGMMKGLGFSD